MNELKVGIAGYGLVGKQRLKCVESHPKLKTVAICDKIFENMSSISEDIRYEKLFEGVGTVSKEISCYANYKLLLEEDLDILFVCLTNDLAKEVTIAGLEKGLHVFCEKPPGRSLEEIRSVIECEKKHPSLKLMYGFNHRHHKSVQEALKLVNSGELGRVLNLRGIYGKSMLVTFNQNDWRTKREKSGGGILLDQGIHMLDLMRMFAGDFEVVYGFVSNEFWEYEVEDNAYALMKTSDGVIGMLHSSATQWRHRFQLEIGLSNGSIILGGILTSSKSYGAETLTIVRASPVTDNGDPMEHTIRYNKDPSWEEEIKHFADVVINNKPVEYGSSKDAFNTMKLVFKIYHADSSWRDKFQIPNPSNYNI